MYVTNYTKQLVYWVAAEKLKRSFFFTDYSVNFEDKDRYIWCPVINQIYWIFYNISIKDQLLKFLKNTGVFYNNW